MSKKYDLYCPKHGHIHIEVEKPPIKFTTAPFCLFCLERLKQPDKDTQERWQPNMVAEGARA